MITKAGHIQIPYIGRGIIQQPLEFSLANYSNRPFSIRSIAFFSNHPLLVSLFSDYHSVGTFISSPTMMINTIEFRLNYEKSLYIRVTNDSENTVDLYYQIEFLSEGNIEIFERRTEQYPINERPASALAEQPTAQLEQEPIEEKPEEHVVDDPRIRGLFEE